MANKIGRNELCPCGSGLKYKKCCLKSNIKFSKKTGIKNTNSLDGFIRNHNGLDLALTFAALSIDPENHSKDLRLEYLTSISLLRLNPEKPHASINELQQQVDRCLPYHHYEDPPENPFTENIVSGVGNTVVYSGNYTQGVYTLQNLIKTIIYKSNSLDKDFIKECNDTINLSLSISNYIAISNNHKRDILGNLNPNEKIVFDRELSERKESLVIDAEVLEYLCTYANSNKDSLNDLLISLDRIKGDPIKSRINKLPELKVRPFLFVEDSLFVLSPTSIIISLTHFIWQKATKYGCLEKLTELYHQSTISQLFDYLTLKLNWTLEEDSVLIDNKSILSVMFRMDIDKLAIVCIHKISVNDSGKMKNHSLSKLKVQVQKKYKNHEVITVELLDPVGLQLRVMAKTYSEPYILASVYEIVTSIQAYKLDKLYFYYFCKARNVFEKNLTIHSHYMGYKEYFSLYVKNKSFYLSDEKQPDFIVPPFGEFAKCIVTANMEEDHRAVSKNIVSGLRSRLVAVIKSTDYINSYVELDNRSNYIHECVIINEKAVWIKIKQRIDELSHEEFERCLPIMKTISYWVTETKHFFLSLQNLLNHPIDIYIDTVPDRTRVSVDKNVKSIFSTVILEKGIEISINFDNHLKEIDDQFEFHLMIEMFKALNVLVSKTDSFSLDLQEIEQYFRKVSKDKYRRMFISKEIDQKVLLNPKDVGTPRPFQDAVEQLIMDEIVPRLREKAPKIGLITHKKDKEQLAKNIIYTVLLPYLRAELAKHDSIELLGTLMDMNESNVYHQAKKHFVLPYRISCYAQYEDTISNLVEDYDSQAKSSIAIRTLIEHLSAESTSGTLPVSMSQIDKIVCLMSLILFWGNTSDIIKHDLFETRLSVLKSGRIGTNSHEIVDQYFDKYMSSKYSRSVDSVIHNIEDTSEVILDETLLSKLNNAFLNDFGFTFETCNEIVNVLVEYALSLDGRRVAKLPEAKAYTILSKYFKMEISEDHFKLCMNHLSLINRKRVDILPNGYKYFDIMPWRYNRRLSYLYKPVVKTIINNEKMYLFTPRHIVKSFTYVLGLIRSAKFRCDQNSEMDLLNGFVGSIKGKYFQNSVERLFAKYTDIYIDREVSIKPNGDFDNDVDIGDIDIFVISEKNKIILNIECKNTIGARNSMEMIQEMDYYFNGDNSYSNKHYKRDQWLLSNTEIVSNKVGIDVTSFNVVSLFVTSQVMPSGIIKNDTIGIKLISFDELSKYSLDDIIKHATKNAEPTDSA